MLLMEGLEASSIRRGGRDGGRDANWKGWKCRRLEGLEASSIGRVGRDGGSGRCLFRSMLLLLLVPIDAVVVVVVHCSGR